MTNGLRIAPFAGILIATIWVLQQSSISIQPRYHARMENSTARAWNGAAERLHRIRANQHTGLLSTADFEKARHQAFAASKIGGLGMNWSEMGPDNFGGRTRALLVDNADGERLYAGSVSGGLFISKNGGKSWQNAVGAESLVVSALTQAEDGTLYMGTGSSFDATAAGGILFPGSGLYRSTDRGKTFTKLVGPSSSNSISEAWSAINDIEVDPANPQHIYVATYGGLRYSTDGGVNWNTATVDYSDIPSVGTVIQDPRPAGDIAITESGRLFYSTYGNLYYSDAPASGQPFKHLIGETTEDGKLFHYQTNAARVVLAVSPSQPATIYSIAVDYVGALQGVYRSDNEGEDWRRILSPIEGYFTPMTVDDIGSQGIYDLALEVHPTNPERIYIGGVQLWQYDGDLKRIASETGELTSAFYVHSDKHIFAFDPSNANRLFVGTDGGVSLSNDAGETWFSANRGYNVAQVYGLAFDTEGKVFLGTQDNGTLQLESEEGNSEFDAERINGGDGFDCDYSVIADMQFATVYQSQVGRRRGTTDGEFALICGDDLYCGEGPFYTAIRLWESANDTTSRDSIWFTSDLQEQAIGSGNGSNTFFSGTIQKLQSNGDFVAGSIAVTVDGQTYKDETGSGDIKDEQGETLGSFDYQTGLVTINFKSAPLVNKSVMVSYYLSYDAGLEVELKSNTPDVTFKANLPTDIEPGDSLLFQDPIQSLLALSISDDVAISRNALDYKNTTQWWPLGVPGTAESLEFSADGDHLFVGTLDQGAYRVSGLNSLYNYVDSSDNEVTVTKIFDTDQVVTHMAVDPSNANNVLITLGNYGNSKYVYLSTTALTTDSTDSFTSVQGDLPAMPVYTGMITILDSSTAMIGTDVGIYATTNLHSGNVSWSLENGDMPAVPVFDIRQQILGWKDAENHEVIYVGTHGRGVWESSNLVSVEPITHHTFEQSQWQSFAKAYPNPIDRQFTLEFSVSSAQRFGLVVTDLMGRSVMDLEPAKLWTEGEYQVNFEMDLEAGIYQILRTDQPDQPVRIVVR